MRTLVGIWGCVLLGIICVSGCDRTQQVDSVDKVGLPKDVAGVWQARGNAWKIVLTEDGQIGSALFPLGKVELRPNETARMEMADGKYSTYVVGECDVEYDAKTRELSVTIDVDQIDIRFVDNRINGKSKDIFIGTVSQDGDIWETEWFQFIDLGERFPTDPEDIKGILVFDRIKQTPY